MLTGLLVVLVVYERIALAAKRNDLNTVLTTPRHMEIPQTRYLASTTAASITWHSSATNRQEILLIPGWVSHIDLFWQYPDRTRGSPELGRFARVAIYDKPRNVGIRTRRTTRRRWRRSIEQVTALIDAAGLQRPAIVAVYEGGITGCIFAAIRPERVARLILLNSTVVGFDRRGMHGTPDEVVDRFIAFIRQTADEAGATGRMGIAGSPASPTQTGRGGASSARAAPGPSPAPTWAPWWAA